MKVMAEIKGQKLGYARVSTEDQNLARQMKLFEDLEVEKIFSDKQSGKNLQRKGLEELIGYARNGDVLYVESFSRLARSTKDLLSLVEKLQEKNIRFVSIKEAVDTDTPSGKFMLTVFAALSELERENILLRQAEGIAIAKENGKYKGRPANPLPENWDTMVQSYLRGDLTAKATAKRLGISSATFYRLLERNNIKKKQASRE